MTTSTTPISLAGTSSPVSVAQELGLGLTSTLDLNNATVRSLAGAGGSGTTIDMNSLRNKSYISATIVINAVYRVYYSTGNESRWGLGDMWQAQYPGPYTNAGSVVSESINSSVWTSQGVTVTAQNWPSTTITTAVSKIVFSSTDLATNNKYYYAPNFAFTFGGAGTVPPTLVQPTVWTSMTIVGPSGTTVLYRANAIWTTNGVFTWSWTGIANPMATPGQYTITFK